MATRTIRPLGARLGPKMVLHDVTFSSGGATVTAAAIGLTKILGIGGIAWKATANRVATLHTTETFVVGGVTSVALRHVETIDTAGAVSPVAIDTIVPILFIGE